MSCSFSCSLLSGMLTGFEKIWPSPKKDMENRADVRACLLKKMVVNARAASVSSSAGQQCYPLIAEVLSQIMLVYHLDHTISL